MSPQRCNATAIHEQQCGSNTREMIARSTLTPKPRDPNSPMLVIITDFRAQCSYYLCTWIPRLKRILNQRPHLASDVSDDGGKAPVARIEAPVWNKHPIEDATCERCSCWVANNYKERRNVKENGNCYTIAG